VYASLGNILMDFFQARNVGTEQRERRRKSRTHQVGTGAVPFGGLRYLLLQFVEGNFDLGKSKFQKSINT